MFATERLWIATADKILLDSADFLGRKLQMLTSALRCCLVNRTASTPEEVISAAAGTDSLQLIPRPIPGVKVRSELSRE